MTCYTTESNIQLCSGVGGEGRGVEGVRGECLLLNTIEIAQKIQP